MKLRRFDQTAPGFEADFGAFLARRRPGAQPDIDKTVAAIIEDVRERGAAAVCHYTRTFDDLELDEATLNVPGLDLKAVATACPHDIRKAIDHAAQRIEDYHRLQRPTDGTNGDTSGVRLDWRWTPVDAVGLYVPGGRASYPSTVLMNAIPARAAGVERIVMVSPNPTGQVSPALAYAAIRAGVSEFYPIGGAQAVAALAIGAGPIKPVDKIVGPGNAYVAAAKRMVFGLVGIDSIAGPSELTVVAGEENRADWTAADLLSQAEHDPLAQSILITDSEAFAAAVDDALAHHLAELPTAQTATQSLQDYGATVIAPREAFAAIVNQIAPEHVEIAIQNPEQITADVRHAGAVFVGEWACEALGDYLTGSNHVLPTSGAARFSSGLSTTDFMKRTSVQTISRAGFDDISGSAQTLAQAEGLPAHALSVSLRRRSS